MLQGQPKVVGKDIHVYKEKPELLTLEQEILLWRQRIVIHKNLKKNILNALHQNHLGVKIIKNGLKREEMCGIMKHLQQLSI